MIGQSLPEYYFIRVCIAGLRLVGPASVAYLIACAATGTILVSPVLGIVAACEASFYGFFFLRSRRFNRPTPPMPPRLSRSARQELFEKCASQMTADYPSGWFLPFNSEIKRENARDWILWALFASTPEHASPEWEEEIDEYTSVVEKSLGRKLEPGRAHGVQSLRLSFDPIYALHRPLIWYMIVGLVDTLTSIFLLSLGFKHYAPRGSYFRAFPPRPLLALFTKSVATPHFSYWYRPSRAGSESKNPILFLHGIGIGLHPYVPLFRDILRTDPTQSLLLMEFLPVSFRITSPMPSRAETLAAINATLEDLSIPQVVLAAHSYGTFLAGHILTPPLDPEDPAHTLNSKVASLVLIDPIPFLLHLPAVAYNFLYRPPGLRRSNEWQLWYFASRDADVARVLGRCFFWEEGCVWRTDLERFSETGRRVAVVLGGGDQIVPSADVRAYLTDGAREWDCAGKGAERWMSRSGALEVLWFEGLDHATVFETKERRQLLMRALGVVPPRAANMYGAVERL
ncbi:hypothetical protein B0H15DRAFT_847784 [Mycena belliarum]|uniref:AB hydrolase-1 domain-containing protein n=1 Tax=Mycena belliarum TaxID=1033014 RepID=A0AAD6U520_9AGAR|nr:hypothetical protein B0H15DRAFT_847784 [Mycena belliae]